ncbi:hypothetical protein, partial [Sphingomonas sp.]|uniref:hypothetical protein n=1 Tax=Sphingomonas sp. TaxID=28214 RepID=UPI002D7EDB9B
MTTANQQLRPEIRFHHRHLLTERGLGDSENLRGAGQAAGIDHLNERLQAASFHSGSSCRIISD